MKTDPLAKTISVLPGARTSGWLVLFLGIVASFPSLLYAQVVSSVTSSVPRLVNFSGTVADSRGKPVSGTTGVTFSLYKEQTGGSPLWLETQNVTADAKGHYTVQLGSTRSEGLPVDLFDSKDSRWLGVTISGQEEQPRVLLLSVPYALKAADAETLGGLPASAFMLAAPAIGSSISSSETTNSITTQAALPPATVTGSGTANTVPLWTGASTLGNSVLFQTGSGSTARIGINTPAPASPLDVKGAATVRGTLALPATGVATSAGGKNSQGQNFIASVFNSTTATGVNQTFRWQAEPASNNTANTSATLNLLFAPGTANPAETGLKIASNGQIWFVPGQVFPGTGNGTITGVTAGTDLTGGGASGNVTLNLDTTATDARYARLSSSNTFSGSQTINNTLSLNAAASSILNVTASNSGTHAPVAQFGSAGANDANSIRVYSGDSSGPFSELFVASANTFIPGTFAGDGGIRLAPGKNFWIGDANGYRTVISKDGILDQEGPIEAVGVEIHTTAVNGWGLSNSSGKGGSGAQFIAGDGDNTVGSGFGGGDGIDVRGGSGDKGGAGGNFMGGNGVEEAGAGIYVSAGTGPNGYSAGLDGDVLLNGTINGHVPRILIDHPFDAANKYLNHAAITSSEELDLYTGNATLDNNGEAEVRMPDWFEAINGDFRYQLTSIGAPGPGLYVAQELSGSHFKIAGGKPGAKVSWQISAVRQDAYTQAHPLVVEQPKTGRELGHYLHPELYGAGQEQSITAARFPGIHSKQATSAAAVRQQLKNQR